MKTDWQHLGEMMITVIDSCEQIETTELMKNIV